jgi:hypothetical protein
MGHPVLLVLPYLELTDPIEFGPWWLGPTDQYDGCWLSAEFERLSRRFLVSFRAADGGRLDGGALLVRQETGADGRPPTDAELVALEVAIGFATIHQNAFWSPEVAHDPWAIATADNADVWAQPINVSEGWLAVGRGGRVSITTGGLNLNDPGLSVVAPLELHRPRRVRPDAEVLDALYVVLAEPTDALSARSRRLRIAVRWLLRSWRNTPSITWDDRLVYVKIATEALAGTESTGSAAEHLEDLFSRAAVQRGEGVGMKDLLWDDAARPVVRHWTAPSGVSKSSDVSAFAHWYWALADARNALVHGEEAPTHDYEVEGSPYNGSLVEVADRVVREAVTVSLGECGYPAVWRRGMTRASYRMFERLADSSD